MVAGRYRIERKLGSGSMGTVYLARDERTGSRVALKLMKAERLDAEGLATLQREFSSIASLHHPQIARAHDSGYTEGNRVPFYTREYIEGVPVALGPPGSAAQTPAGEAHLPNAGHPAARRPSGAFVKQLCPFYNFFGKAEARPRHPRGRQGGPPRKASWRVALRCDRSRGIGAEERFRRSETLQERAISQRGMSISRRKIPSLAQRR